MNLHATLAATAIDQRNEAGADSPSRVLVLFESTSSGVAALREAVALCDEDTRLTVVTLAPQSLPSRCCARGPSVEVLNCVVRDEAESELSQAREMLGDGAEGVTFRSLVGTRDPPLDAWAAGQGFDVIVLPARRLAFGGHPFARRLRRATRAELRLIG